MTDPVAVLPRGRRHATPAASGSTAAVPATWSGRRSIIGWLDDDDVSLTLRRRRREVTRHAGRAADRGRRRHLRRARRTSWPAGPDDQWFGYFGYACRPDLPGPPRRRRSRTRCGCGRGTSRLFEHEPSRASRRTPAPGPHPPAGERPRRVRRGVRAGPGAPARRQLLRGEPDLPRHDHRRPRPRRRPTCGCASSTPRRTPGSCSTTCRARGWLLSSSPERYALVDRRPDARDQADQGHHAARRDARRRTSAHRDAARDRPAVPRREPDDRRPAPQRRVDGVRAGHGRGAGADGRSSPTRTCTSW